MARFGLTARPLRGGALFLVGFGVLSACGGAESHAARVAAREQNPNLPCAEDEVREYFCDDLLPLTSSRPAPEPYDNCPATTDIRHSAFPAVGRVAGFDEGFTAYTRQRLAGRATGGTRAPATDGSAVAPPGHSCCYGWCAKVKVADPSAAAPQACRDSYGLAQKFCMRELENGTSEPAQSPFDHCPVAIKPPETEAFSAPASALLDVSETGQRRRDKQLADCCYGWCSQIPAGTVLKPAHPKTK